MNILLDSCVFLWMMRDPKNISQKAQEAIVSANGIYLSSISIWEMGFKDALGKLPLARPLDSLIQELSSQGFLIPLAFSAEAAAGQVDLPLIHKDPFDRMLICQARTHNLTIVTPDALIRKYDVETLW